MGEVFKKRPLAMTGFLMCFVLLLFGMYEFSINPETGWKPIGEATGMFLVIAFFSYLANG